MSEAPDGGPQGAAEDTSFAAMEAAVNGDQPAETTEEELPADDAGAEQTPPKPRQTAQERIDEVTAARREAERRADEAERRVAYLEGLTQGQRPTKPAETAPPQEEGRPDPAVYQTDDDYIEAVAEWKAGLIVDRKLKEREQQTEQQSAAEQWNASQAKAKAAHDDYDAVVRKPGWVCTPVMFDAMKTSEAGGEVAYHLATNPDEARRIAALPPISQVREIGRLEARLSDETPPKTPPKTATDAPPATPQVRGAGGQFKPAPDTTDFAAFEKMAKASG